MKKRLLCMLLCALLTVSLLALPAFADNEIEDNDYFDNATTLRVNEEMIGSLSDDDTEDFFRFSLSAAGSVNIILKHEGCNADACEIELLLYNERGAVIHSERFDARFSRPETVLPIGLDRGSYYLELRTVSAASYEGSYSLFVGYSSADSWEKETNDAFDTANKIDVNKEIYGSLRWGDEDYYEFRLTQPGYIQLRLSSTGCDNADCAIGLYLYSTTGSYIYNQELSGEEDSQTDTIKIGLDKGNYNLYLRSEQTYSDYLGSYHFRINFTASTVWEREPNEYIETATKIGLNTKYYGSTFFGDEDYYRFELPAAGLVNFSFQHDYDSDPYTELVLELSDGNASHIEEYKWNVNNKKTGTTPVMQLPAGVYYLYVYESTGLSGSEYWGQYNLTVKYNTTGFVDVDPTSFYYPAVTWAVENNITDGMDDTHFAPDRTCTRGQVVTFLWRACGQPAPKTSRNPFVDVGSKAFYYKPVLWAVENNITSGMDATHFNPTGACTRGQVVTFLWRAKGKPEPSGSNPFVDVGSKAFYYKPVLWAAENNITSGMDATHFNPTGACTRGQIVTFLYRAFGTNTKN